MEALSLHNHGNEFISLIVEDGVCIHKETLSTPKQFIDTIAQNSNLVYQHATLTSDENGLVFFKPLPYKATPFETKNISVDLYHNSFEGKYWAIWHDKTKTTVFFKNAQSDLLWVAQQVDNSRSHVQRIKDKISNGYSFFKKAEFNSLTRTIN